MGMLAEMTIGTKRYWKLKGCPKCTGDVLVFDDEAQCLQCGWEREDCTVESVTAIPSVQQPADRIGTRSTPGVQRPIGRGLGRYGREASQDKAIRDADIRRLRAEGTYQSALAKTFGLTVSAISLICARKR